MNKMNLQKLILFLMAVTMVFACASESTDSNVNNADSTAVDSNQVESNMTDPNTVYKMPSPVQLYIFLKEANATFDKEILNSTDNISKYLTVSSKGINFGIYASDLAYSTVFEEAQITFTYYKAVKQLVDDLSLTEGFDEEIAERISANMNNTDSLYEITSFAYWEACNYLETQNKNELLSFILAGGWLESLYVAMNSVDDFSNDNPILGRIADQQLLLANLLDQIKTVDQSSDLKQLTDKLKDLETSFDLLYDNKDVKLTKEQYDEIFGKVKKIRNEFIN